MRKKLSVIIKLLTAVCVVTGLLFAFCTYERDGYSHWYKRLLFFTTQSNIWIMITLLLLVIEPFMKLPNRLRCNRVLYILKYIFTVSITVTGLVFCGLLAPFAGEEDYHAWSLASVLTHVVVPLLAIVDFVVDDTVIKMSFGRVWSVTIPPLYYCIFSMILGACGVEFRAGHNYAYFFLDYSSAAGIFGFSSEPPILGTAYWIVFLLALILGLGFIFARIKGYKPRRLREISHNLHEKKHHHIDNPVHE